MTTQTTDITQLSAPERWRRAIGALAKVVADPTRTDEVLVFSAYANAGTMHHRLHRFYDDARGQKLYAEHRTIDSHTVDLDALAALPDGTLGHAYASFLRARGFTPEVFDGPPDDVTDPKASYVIQRMRQTHDLWHVVTGHDTNPAGEIALQAFTYAQVRAPSSLILAAVGTLRGTRYQPTLVRDVVRAFRAGRHAEAFVAFAWEDHWATPLADVRAMLGVEPVSAAA
ncbi:MAG TPA: Coq4 family protein [Kofleriaceae bacterium]|nr:Coq4 family protein [Kofleriaceae bacterium]